ncbi:hypothetical protein [Pleomorphomonas sp. PLEO]|uniref:hypothetical protein n=1 Tax=Pleomorphomonas sp. PLEO TaxID=3239306 RepID=UPI00351ECB5E
MTSEDEAPSDKKEKEKDAPAGVRPTVIAELRARKEPTTPKPSQPGVLRPTVIGRAEEPRAARSKQTKSRPSTPNTNFVVAPTAIPGDERKRIVVAADDLRDLSPQAGSHVIDQALRIIGSFPAESANERQIVLWGHDAQQRYGGLVSRAVDLSQAQVLVRTAGYLRRMAELLGAIDIEAASGAGSDGGILVRALRRANARIDTIEELERARVEINQLVGLTGAALEELLSLREALGRLDDEIGETANAIEAAALAAQFLSNYFLGKREELSRRFLERSMSLTQSLAQLRGNASVASVQAEQPLRLIAAIQSVVLVSLPDLLSSFAALNTLARSGGRPTRTEAGEIAFRLRDVLQNLKA